MKTIFTLMSKGIYYGIFLAMAYPVPGSAKPLSKKAAAGIAVGGIAATAAIGTAVGYGLKRADQASQAKYDEAVKLGDAYQEMAQKNQSKGAYDKAYEKASQMTDGELAQHKLELEAIPSKYLTSEQKIELATIEKVQTNAQAHNLDYQVELSKNKSAAGTKPNQTTDELSHEQLKEHAKVAAETSTDEELATRATELQELRTKLARQELEIKEHIELEAIQTEQANRTGNQNDSEENVDFVEVVQTPAAA